jgi:DNA-binding beta-propeller fold protein YncE
MNNWSVIATQGTDLGQVHLSGTLTATSGLAVDGAGHLYVADTDNNRVQMYTPGP